MEVRPGYKLTDAGIVPEDWEVVPVAVAGQVLGGRQRSPGRAGIPTPYLRVANVFDGYIRTDNVLEMPFTAAERERFQLRNGDILLNEGQSIDLVGRSAIYRDDPPSCCFQNTLVRFRAASGVQPEFVQPLFQQYVRTGVFASIALQTTSIAHLGAGRLGKLKIPLPPLVEQRAIATALSDADALLAALDRLIAKKRDLKQAAMQQLLTGRTRLPGFRGEWRDASLGDVVDTDPETLSISTPPDFRFRYIALEDVDHGVLRGFTERVLRDAPSRARRRLRKNDILVSTVRPNLQSHLHFAREGGPWVCSTGFSVLRGRPGVSNPAYVFAQLFADSVCKQIESLLTGSNYPAINSADVRALTIPMPEYDEQTAIAAVLTDMDAELAALEQRRDKTRALKQAMMQELLTGRTRLVPAGETDA